MNVLEYSIAQKKQTPIPEPDLSQAFLAPEEKLFRLLQTEAPPPAAEKRNVWPGENFSAPELEKKLTLFRRPSPDGIKTAAVFLTLACAAFVIFNSISFSKKTPLQNTIAPAAPVLESEPSKPQSAVYRLVGISWDEKGYVAMVEKTGESARFVRQGDDLGGGYKVREITELTVTLEGGGRFWTLR